MAIDMVNLLETGAAWLADQFSQHGSEEVLYQHLRSGSIHRQGLVTATPGQSEHDSETFEGVAIREWSYDWIVVYSDLLAAIDSDADHRWPQRGDSILWPVDSATETIATGLDGTSSTIASGTWHIFTIGALQGGVFYELVDPYLNLIRVHTQYIGQHTLSAGSTWPRD